VCCTYEVTRLASCLINAQSIPAHRRDRPALIGWTTTWQMIGRCPVPITLTADAHFSACLSALFYWTRCFENNVPFDNTTRFIWSICSGN